MKYCVFNTDPIAEVGIIPPVFSVDEIEGTPMLFSASPEFARANGGPMTEWALDVLERSEDYQRVMVDRNTTNHEVLRHIIIDTKVVMLMEGQYPAIPGWHCDAVKRCSTYAQPDLGAIDDNGLHWVVTTSTHDEGVSNTEFLETEDGVVCFVDPTRVWGSVNERINETLNLSPEDKNSLLVTAPKIKKTKDGVIYKFTQRDLHQAARAHNSGWRWFFRASMMKNPPLNKIRHQVQVYADPNKGW